MRFGKASQLKRAGLIAVALLLISDLPLVFAADMTYHSVTASSSNRPWQMNGGRYGGVFFYIYASSVDHLLYYQTSKDGVTWANNTLLVAAVPISVTVTFPFSVFFSNSSNRVYIAIVNGAGSDLYTYNATISGYTITAGTQKTVTTGASYPMFTETANYVYLSYINGTGATLRRAPIGNTDWGTKKAISSALLFTAITPTYWKTDQIMYLGEIVGGTMTWFLVDNMVSVKTGNIGSCAPCFRNIAVIPGKTAGVETVNLFYANDSASTQLHTYYMNSSEAWSTRRNLGTITNATANGLTAARTHDYTYLLYHNSSGLYGRNYNYSSSSWGSQITHVASISAGDKFGSQLIFRDKIILTNYGYAGVMNVSTISTTTTSTTTSTATVTTLTTQTTTNDTIVDAVANQFAAIMENLFPALIIILVFVYLAYKAGASGEVLAYVFIITLVLTSFINLMPWWITVIVSVIMIAILLNYRQRGGGVPR